MTPRDIRRALRPGPQRDTLTTALAHRMLNGEEVQPCAPLERESWAEAELFCRAIERVNPHMLTTLAEVLGEGLTPVAAAIAGYRRDDVGVWARHATVRGLLLSVSSAGVVVSWPGTRLLMRWGT